MLLYVKVVVMMSFPALIVSELHIVDCKIQMHNNHIINYLLSSKAGGCGLNLIGGNRLVLFDPDWNPANDKQAAARVWRAGQKKRVYIYRFLSTGTIEEKVYQLQMSKEGLQKVIQQELAGYKMQGNNFSTEDLRDLFTFYEDATSEIHGKMNCTRCREHTADAIRMDEEEDIGGFLDACLT
ncbi:putative DNA helicase [Helianthus anomalus]